MLDGGLEGEGRRDEAEDAGRDDDDGDGDGEDDDAEAEDDGREGEGRVVGVEGASGEANDASVNDGGAQPNIYCAIRANFGKTSSIHSKSTWYRWATIKAPIPLSNRSADSLLTAGWSRRSLPLSGGSTSRIHSFEDDCTAVQHVFELVALFMSCSLR